jgi:hypothetical protein
VIPLAVAGVLVTWHPRIDVEPAAFFLDGYSVHVGVQPAAAPRLLLSVGAYAFDVPDFLVDDRDRFDLRLYLGAGAFADYFLTAPDHGWVVGGQLGTQSYQATEAATGATDRWTSALVLVRGGYEWHPGGWGGYLFPWVGAAIDVKVAGDPGAYHPATVLPYFTVDLGWRLE